MCPGCNINRTTWICSCRSCPCQVLRARARCWPRATLDPTPGAMETVKANGLTASSSLNLRAHAQGRPAHAPIVGSSAWLPGRLPGSGCLAAELVGCLASWPLGCLAACLPACLLACLRAAFLPSCHHALLHPCIAACLPSCLPAFMLSCLHALLPSCLAGCFGEAYGPCQPPTKHVSPAAMKVPSNHEGALPLITSVGRRHMFVSLAL